MGILASGDGPRARGPARQVDQVGDLGHLGAFAHVAAVSGDRRGSRRSATAVAGMAWVKG